MTLWPFLAVGIAWLLVVLALWALLFATGGCERV